MRGSLPGGGQGFYVAGLYDRVDRGPQKPETVESAPGRRAECGVENPRWSAGVTGPPLSAPPKHVQDLNSVALLLLLRTI